MLCRCASRNFLMASLITIASSAVLFMPASTRAQPIPQMDGVYGANLSSSQTATALINSNVDGLQVTEPWSTVEAQEEPRQRETSHSAGSSVEMNVFPTGCSLLPDAGFHRGDCHRRTRGIEFLHDADIGHDSRISDDSNKG